MFTTLEIYVFYIITDDNIIQFGDVTNTAGSNVYIQYVGGKHTQNDWYCTASTTSSHDIQVSAVDVRFQKYDVSTGRCDGGLSYLYLSDSNHNSTIRCQDKTILGNYDTIFSSAESTITIQLHLDGDPQFVWIAVSGMSVAHLYYFISLFLYLLSICLLLSYFAIYYHYCYLSYISSRLWISQTGISFDNRLCNNTPEILL